MPDSQPHDVSLETLASGAAGELFDAELRRVLANIQDPNTEAKAKRQIVLTVTFLPNDKREGGSYVAGTVAKLAPIRPHASTLYFGERDGQPVAVTFDPSQHSLFASEQDPAVRPITPSQNTAS